MESDKPTLTFHSTIRFLATNLPWILLAIVIVIGGLSSLFYGLPWAQKTDVQKLAENVEKLADVVAEDHRTVEGISQTQAVAATQQQMTANILAQLQDKLEKQQEATESNSIHIEGLEADEKARDSEERLRRR